MRQFTNEVLLNSYGDAQFMGNDEGLRKIGILQNADCSSVASHISNAMLCAALKL